jgi:transposase
MTPDTWAAIKRMHGSDKLAIAEIARRLRLDRKTVRKVIHQDRFPLPHRVPRRPSLLQPFKSFIAERLAAHPHIPGTVLFHDIQRQGYSGHIRTVTKYLQKLRDKSKEVFLRLETPPGEQAQCDWANCGAIKIGSAWRKLSAFVMVLSYSRLMFVQFTLSQCLEDFIQAHLSAFAFFGGIVRKILYDNLKLVVLSRFGGQVHFNPKFLEFSGIFGFEPVACNVARGNEKGKAENGIRYLRSGFLAGKDSLSWPSVQNELRLWLDTQANVRIHRTTSQRPLDRWQEERPFLQPLPAVSYDASILKTVPASHQALVRFDGNAYTVPHTWAYKALTLRATQDQVRLSQDGRDIAVHARSYDRGKVIENPQHIEALLATKKKAFIHHLQKKFLALGEGTAPYLAGLMNQELYPHRHLHRILELASTYSVEEVQCALARALEANAFGAAYVHNILLQQRAAQGLKEILPLSIPQKPDWNDLTVQEPDLSLYDRLIEDPPSQRKDIP